ncbi:MAG: aminotransferase class V-fold PLP-dependent enzyme [Chloroflexota bacterium]
MTNQTMPLATLRAELPLTKTTAYFQTGTYGLTPDSVTQLVYETLQFMNHSGTSSPDTLRKLHEQEAMAKDKLARFLNVSVPELAWMPNTSQAMHKVLHAMRWEAGDEFIVTSAEHVSMQGACQALERDYGVVVKTIPANGGDEVLLAALEEMITARTKLFCISEVSTMDGRRLPVKHSTQIAHARKVLVLVDVAQSVGQLPVDLTALGCDFAIGSIHKWMLGTKGLGFLYVNQTQIPSFIPDFIPDYHPWTKMDEPLPPIDAASRADQGTHNYAIRIGVNRTIDILNAIGINHIAAHCKQLTQLFFDAIGDWAGVNIISSTNPAHITGLCCINFDGYAEPQVRELIAKLLDEQIVVKYQPEPNGIRISFAAFNTKDDVQRLVASLKQHL